MTHFHHFGQACCKPTQAVAALDFDPSRNYLFCYHPHGVQSVGAMACASDANK